MNELFTIVERAKKEWESAIDAISEGVIVFDDHTLKIHRSNWPLARWLNTTPHALVGQDLHQAVCGCDQPNCELLGLARSTEIRIAQTISKRTGQRWEVSAFRASPRDSQEGLSVLVIRDITQEYLLQQRMIEAEKNAVILRLTAKIADRVIPSIGYIQHHLSMIMLNLQALRFAFTDYRVALQTGEASLRSALKLDWETIESHYRVEFRMEDIQEAIRHSLEELTHIYGFTQRLKDLEGEAPKMRYNDLIEVLEDAIAIVAEETRNLVVFDRRYEGKLPPIRCNRLHLQTALLYVLIYGIQAIKNRGKLSISTTFNDHSVQVIIETNASLPSSSTYLVSESMNNGIQREAMSQLITTIVDEMGGVFSVHETDPASFAATVTLPIEMEAEFSKQ